MHLCRDTEAHFLVTLIGVLTWILTLVLPFQILHLDLDEFAHDFFDLFIIKLIHLIQLSQKCLNPLLCLMLREA